MNFCFVSGFTKWAWILLLFQRRWVLRVNTACMNLIKFFFKATFLMNKRSDREWLCSNEKEKARQSIRTETTSPCHCWRKPSVNVRLKSHNYEVIHIAHSSAFSSKSIHVSVHWWHRPVKCFVPRIVGIRTSASVCLCLSPPHPLSVARALWLLVY